MRPARPAITAWAARCTLSLAALLVLTSCEAQPAPGADPAAGDELTKVSHLPKPIAGTITQVNAGHGNLFSSIPSADYAALGLTAGRPIRVVFTPAGAEAPVEVRMTVEKTYYDVDVGQPVAVLHRDTLTFAVRDGNFAKQYNLAKDTPFQLHFAGGATE